MPAYATYLEYTLNPDPVTTRETQDLTIIGTLKTKAQLGTTLTSVTVNQIVLNFGKVGSGPTNLTDNDFSIGDIQVPENWKATVSGVICTLTPFSDDPAVVTNENALVFVIKSVPVNKEPGNVTLRVNEASTPVPQSGGEPPTTTADNPGVENILFSKVAGSANNPTLTAEPQMISPGGTTTLSWSGGKSGDTYTLEYMTLDGKSSTSITNHADNTPLSASDQYPDQNLIPPDPDLTLEETSIFILNYTGSKEKGSVQTFVMVTGSAPVINTFEVLMDQSPVTLKWDVTDVNPDVSITVSFDMKPADSNLYTATGHKTFSLAEESRTITLTAMDMATGTKAEKSIPVRYGYKATSILSDKKYKFNLPFSIAMVDNYAYVLNYQGCSITVLDVSNPSSPTLATVLDGTNFQFNFPIAIAMANNYAYVTNFQGASVTVLDISTPASPTLATVLDGTNFQFSGPCTFLILNTYAYVVNNFGNSVTVLDVSTPASPTLTTVLGNNIANFQFMSPYDIALVGDYAYVVNQAFSTITILDLSTPASPTLVTVLDDPNFHFNFPSAIIIFSNHAYVVNGGGNSITVLDVSTPSSPTLATVIDDAGFQLHSPTAVNVMNQYAYVVNEGGNSITVLDVSTPSSPMLAIVLDDASYQFNGLSAMVNIQNHMYVLNEGGNSITVMETPIPPSWVKKAKKHS